MLSSASREVTSVYYAGFLSPKFTWPISSAFTTEDNKIRVTKVIFRICRYTQLPGFRTPPPAATPGVMTRSLQSLCYTRNNLKFQEKQSLTDHLWWGHPWGGSNYSRMGAEHGSLSRSYHHLMMELNCPFKQWWLSQDHDLTWITYTAVKISPTIQIPALAFVPFSIKSHSFCLADFETLVLSSMSLLVKVPFPVLYHCSSPWPAW